MPLPLPVTAVALQRSKGKLGRAAVACMQGLRKNFEDYHILDQERGMCGVFDGHLGDEAAAFCAERLPLHLTCCGDAASMTKAFGDCDDALRKALPKGCEAGSTAVVAKVMENGSHDSVNLLVASLGDSRALLWRRGTESLEVTQEHRPSDTREQQRIEAAGGTVEEDRIDGSLACSRALGAFAFKAPPGSASKVSWVPDVYHWTAKRGDWLIMACDGIWDTISNQQAVDRICRGAGDLGEILESVLHFCIEKEADDNLTLLAIELGAVDYEEASTSITAGDFLKTKDSEVLEQYTAFCQRFGYSIQKEMQAKGPATVSLSKTEPTPSLPRFPMPAATSGPSNPTPLVIVGPSGVGKGTLIAKIRESFAGRFGFSVSHTTRKPRPGEVHGEAYNFVDIETMQKELEIPGRFLEHATVHGNLYGTSLEAVEKVRQKGQICILDVDVQGARQIKEIHSDFNYLFIAPPSLESLEKRLRSRGTETEEKIQTRLRNARSEIEFYRENVDFFNDVLVNDDLGLAIQRALELMRTWYPELVQQVKVTTRRPVSFFVHAARELIADRQKLHRLRPTELEVVGLGNALPVVAGVSSALVSDGHQVVAIQTSNVEVTAKGGKTSSTPQMKINIKTKIENGMH